MRRNSWIEFISNVLVQIPATLPKIDDLCGLHITVNKLFKFTLPKAQPTSKHHDLSVVKLPFPRVRQFSYRVLATLVVQIEINVMA